MEVYGALNPPRAGKMQNGIGFTGLCRKVEDDAGELKLRPEVKGVNYLRQKTVEERFRRRK